MAKPLLNTLLNDTKGLAQRIRQARAQLEMSQSGLAVKAGLSRSALVHYEQGHAMPGGTELVKLAMALKVSPNFLLSGSDNFFQSESPNHVFAGNPQQMIAGMSTCLMVLERETREAVSALLMVMVKAKLSKRQYQGFLLAMAEMAKVIPKMEKGIEEMANKAVDGMSFGKPAAKRKAK